ncbi:Uncharacterised protein [Vibrio cholerae]|uniref:Uncharacterized protein n=1 Tax=Vibrio cholerae TaxID=666 RepID=A0A655YN56_VIBCL|nr:Uncharacterised protein [Vibrio cholerae]CSC41659.1 Uncharacterised protein [Vibrio cholerae]CSC45076.1 Uncharacterised protein [Vibrio cholerae]
MALPVVSVILIDEISGVFNSALIADFTVSKSKSHSGLGKLTCNRVKVLLTVRLRSLVKVLSAFLYSNTVNASKTAHTANTICTIEATLILLNM